MSIRLTQVKIVVFLAFMTAILAIFFSYFSKIFLYNPLLNSLIIGSFLFGVFFTFLQLKFLKRDSECLFFLFSNRTEPLSTWILSGLLVDEKGLLKKVFTSDESQTILGIVDRRLSSRHSINKYLIGILVLLGLLGTFWGLTETITSLSTTMKSLSFNVFEGSESFNQLKEGIQRPLSGMGIAFSSSILGLTCSLALGFLDLQQRGGEKKFCDNLETKLILKSHSTMTSNGPAYIFMLLEQAVECIKELAEKITKTEENRFLVINALQQITDYISQSNTCIANNNEVLRQLGEINMDIKKNFGDFSKSVAEIVKVEDIMFLRKFLEKMLEESVNGRVLATNEIKKEIQTIVRTLSILSEPDEETVSNAISA